MGTLTRRSLLAVAAGAASLTAIRSGAADASAAFAAAKAEGSLVLYTANQLQSEQDLAAGFKQRYPGIAVEIVRVPGSQLAARIEAEAQSGKLAADVIDMSDLGLMRPLQPLFRRYAPPNAADYPASSHPLANLWPKTVWGFVIAYNTATTTNPPKSWADLLDKRFGGQVGLVIAGSGGSSWTQAMFEREALGADYWSKLADNHPVLYSGGAPALTGVMSGEVKVACVQSNTVAPLVREGAPLQAVFPTEGIALTTSYAGLTKTAAHPHAAQLYLDWSLSPEGQSAWVGTEGGFSALPAAGLPLGMKRSDVKFWFPDPTRYQALRAKWIAEWNDIYHYQ